MNEASEPQGRVTELIEQQTAISEVLHAIASSPHDLQPIFDAILNSATRLCRADLGSLRLFEESGLRLVAMRGDPLLVSQAWPLFPVLTEKGVLASRVVTSRLPTHIPDLTALEGDLRDDPWITVVTAEGLRTSLVVPLLNDNEIVGIITLARKQVQPFTDKQISLFTDFAAQAIIALESTRRERQYREMQSELAHANRVATMGQLTASIAHEIKQPIYSMVLSAETVLVLLNREPPDLGQVHHRVASIVREGVRAGEITDRIRALVKKDTSQNEPLDINALIREIVAFTRGETVKHGISIQMRLTDGLPLIEGDRIQLQQVILNLLINAIEAMSGTGEGSGELRISTEKAEADRVLVTVRDSGPGLAPANLERLFHPFYTTKLDGLGMGLSICRSIIEAHGGRLWADANEPRGAVFKFTLPQADEVIE